MIHVAMATKWFNEKQVQEAVTALKDYVKNTRSDSHVVLEDPEKVFLQIGLHKVPITTKNKSIKIRLPNRVIDDGNVCLFVKNIDMAERDFSETEELYKTKMQNAGIETLPDIITLKSLKTEFKEFKLKRALSLRYDKFLVDDRITKFLPTLLGKNFYGKKRVPLKINLLVNNLKSEYEKALDTVQCVVSGRGSNCMVHIGNLEQASEETVQNVLAAVERLAQTIPGGQLNIKSLHIKSEKSVALPIYISTEFGNGIELPPDPEKDLPEMFPEEVFGKVPKPNKKRKGDAKVVTTAKKTK